MCWKSFSNSAEMPACEPTFLPIQSPCSSFPYPRGPSCNQIHLRQTYVPDSHKALQTHTQGLLTSHSSKSDYLASCPLQIRNSWGTGWSMQRIKKENGDEGIARHIESGEGWQLYLYSSWYSLISPPQNSLYYVQDWCSNDFVQRPWYKKAAKHATLIKQDFHQE